MEKEDFLNIYWKYYLNLEEEFLSTIRYVSLDEQNAKTFSIEYIRQYLSICSEIDVFLNKITSGNNIVDYVNYICNDEFYKKIIEEEIVVNSSKWTLEPYKLLIDTDTKMPKNSDNSDEKTWWGLYNKVKHERVDFYIYANLNNVITSLAALYTIEVYYFNHNYYIDIDNDESMPYPKSKLFSCKKLKDNTGGPMISLILDEWDE